MRYYKYYKIKPQYDQRRRCDGSILIGNELYTEKEMMKYKIPFTCADLVRVPASGIYTFFGARLSIYYPRPTD